MEQNLQTVRPRIPRRLLRQAAAWIARMSGAPGSLELERACLAWQAKSAEHRAAYEACHRVWLDVGNLPPQLYRQLVEQSREQRLRRAVLLRRIGMAVLAAALLMCAVAIYLYG